MAVAAMWCKREEKDEKRGRMTTTPRCVPVCVRACVRCPPASTCVLGAAGCLRLGSRVTRSERDCLDRGSWHTNPAGPQIR